MSAFQSIIQKYTKVANQLAEDRLANAMLMAADAHALVAERIQETGVDANGDKMETYSENLMPYWLLNESNFSSPSKIRRFKKNADKGKNNGSYSALRKAYGLPTDKRTLSFDGNMWKSIIPVLERHDDKVTIVVLKARDEENQDKVNWNSASLGINILAFSESERQLLNSFNRERITKLINKNN